MILRPWVKCEYCPIYTNLLTELPAQDLFHALDLAGDTAGPSPAIVDRDVGQNSGGLLDHVLMTGRDHLDDPIEVSFYAGLHGRQPVIQTRTHDNF